LNFLAFGTFSPLRILSAPTFLPLLGQPDFGLKTLQEVPKIKRAERKERRRVRRIVFIEFIYRIITSLKLIKLFWICNKGLKISLPGL